MVKSKENLVSAYAFLIGIVLAVLLGLTINSNITNKTTNTFLVTALVAIGVLIGYLNADEKDSTITFLLASVSLVIVGGLGSNTLIFIAEAYPPLQVLKEIVRMILVLFIPATIIAALKVVFSMAKI